MVSKELSARPLIFVAFLATVDNFFCYVPAGGEIKVQAQSGVLVDHCYLT